MRIGKFLKSVFRKPRLAIAFGIDNNYAMPLSVCLRSLLENSGTKTEKDIFILHSAMETANQDLVEKSLLGLSHFKLHWVLIDKMPFSGLSSGLAHVTHPTYFRFLLPERIPLAYEHVIYLDGDLLVKGDIEELSRLFDPKYPVQACQDQVGYMCEPIFPASLLKSIGVQGRVKYYNSGVMLLNLRMWREQAIADGLLHFGKAHPEALFIADQTLLNCYLRNRVGELPLVWNAQVVHPSVLDGSFIKGPYLVQPSIEEAQIFHFTGETKPWKDPRVKGGDLFSQYCSRTAWPGVSSSTSSGTAVGMG